MMAQSVNGTVTNYTYNQANNELVSSSSPGTSTAYAYDQDGNLLNKNVTNTGTVRWYYTWDAAGDLLKVTNSTGQALYAYDGGGRRVEAVESGAVWYFAYTGTEILYKNRLNTYNCAYIFASGLRIANFANGSTYYYHADALGSIRMITYPNTAVAYTNGYQPYGQYTGTLTGNLGKWAIDKFDGKPYSTATGLYYEYQRWYDPSIGRFISQDSLAGDMSNPQTLGGYAYASDMPTTLTDPSGQAVMYTLNTWGATPCRASKDFWAHLECSFTNPQAIILGLEFSPEGAAVGLGIWGVEEGAPYLPLIITGGLTVGALGLTVGYEFFTGQLKLSDTSWSSGNSGGVRTGIGGTDPVLPKTPAPWTGGTGPDWLGNYGITPRPTGGRPVDNIYDTLAKPIRWVKNHPNAGRICLAGAVVAGLGLFAWEIGETARRNRGPVDPRGDVGILLAGCVVAIGGFAMMGR